MKKLLTILLTVVVSANSLATSTARRVLVSNQNSASMGFRLELDKEGKSTETWVVTAHFPKQIHEDWPIRGIQTFLFDSNGTEVSSTTSSVNVTSGEPALLFHFKPDSHDMAVVVQYSCPKGEGYMCSESRTIPSVREFFSEEASSTEK